MKAILTVANIVIDVVMIGVLGLFLINCISNADLETKNWRNYDVSVSMQNGITTEYKVPVRTIILNSMDDTLDQIVVLASSVASERD